MFAVAGGDHRRVDIEEALFLEELVDRVAHAIPHPGDGPEGIGARPQMGDRAQELERVALLLQGIGLRVGRAVDGDPRGLHFGGLSLAGRLLDEPFDRHAAPGRELLDFRLIVLQARFGDDLDVAEAGAVVQFDEAETRLGIPPGADPALQDHVAADRIGTPGFGDGSLLRHGWNPPCV